jgi:hypothetical protein
MFDNGKSSLDRYRAQQHETWSLSLSSDSHLFRVSFRRLCLEVRKTRKTTATKTDYKLDTTTLIYRPSGAGTTIVSVDLVILADV